MDRDICILLQIIKCHLFKRVLKLGIRGQPFAVVFLALFICLALGTGHFNQVAVTCVQGMKP